MWKYCDSFVLNKENNLMGQRISFVIERVNIIDIHLHQLKFNFQLPAFMYCNNYIYNVLIVHSFLNLSKFKKILCVMKVKKDEFGKL